MSRQRVEYSMSKFHKKVSKRHYLCIVTECDCPSKISKETFQREYLDPLRRAIDQYLSAVIHWKDLELVSNQEFSEVQALWQRVDQYIRNQ